MNRKGPPQPYLCFFPFSMRQEDLATSLSSGEGNKNMQSSLSLSLRPHLQATPSLSSADFINQVGGCRFVDEGVPTVVERARSKVSMPDL